MGMRRANIRKCETNLLPWNLLDNEGVHGAGESNCSVDGPHFYPGKICKNF